MTKQLRKNAWRKQIRLETTECSKPKRPLTARQRAFNAKTTWRAAIKHFLRSQALHQSTREECAKLDQRNCLDGTQVFSTWRKFMTGSVRKCFGSDCVNSIVRRKRKLHWPDFVATRIRGTIFDKKRWLIWLDCHLNQMVGLRPNEQQATLLLTVRKQNRVMLITSRSLMLQHIQTNTLFYVDLRENGVLLIDLVTINLSILVDTSREGWMQWKLLFEIMRLVHSPRWLVFRWLLLCCM